MGGVAAPPRAGEPMVVVDDIAKVFDVSAPWLNRVIERKPRTLLRAVDGVSFEIARGETLALVGESGCGKSTTGRLILKLLAPSGGSVRFKGEEIAHLTGDRLRAMRRHLQIIFQDPYASLNPRMTIQDILLEPMQVHGIGTEAERLEKVAELLRIVGLLPEHARRYPHQFSGGQRQRIGIARALTVNPDLIVCDEPVSALDVSVQAQVLQLLEEIRARLNLAMLFITHDLRVAAQVCDHLAVMSRGEVVEYGPAHQLFSAPSHPYTRALFEAAPGRDYPFAVV